MRKKDDRRLKLLVVSRGFLPDFGGELIYMLRICKLLQKRGVDVSVVSVLKKDLLPSENIEGIPVRRIGLKILRKYPYANFLLSLPIFLVSHFRQFDVLHFISENADATYVGILLGRLLGIKTVYKMVLFREDDPMTIRHGSRLGRVRHGLLSLADCHMSISTPLTESALKSGLTAHKVHQVYQGVDTELFEPLALPVKKDRRRQLGLPLDVQLVVFVGAIVERKGVDILIDAWTAVVRTLRTGNVHLLMIGPDSFQPSDGPDYQEQQQFADELKRRIDQSGIADTVTFVGYSEQVHRYMQAADMFVFPSRWEGFGNVIIEAMACGLPCLIAPLDGIARDIARDGFDGIIVTSNKPADYARQVCRLLEDSSAARSLGLNARRTAVEKFDLNRIVDDYLQLYRSLLAGSTDLSGPPSQG